MKLNDKFLRMSNLANQSERPTRPATNGITGFSAKHIYHLIRIGQFPAPIKIGRASLWRLSDVNRWLESHTSSSDEEKQL